jgi:hypothetical protein
MYLPTTTAQHQRDRHSSTSLTRPYYPFLNPISSHTRAMGWRMNHPKLPHHSVMMCATSGMYQPGTYPIPTTYLAPRMDIYERYDTSVVNIPIYPPFSPLFKVSITFLISFRLPLFRLYYLETTDIFLTFFSSNTLLIYVTRGTLGTCSDTLENFLLRQVTSKAPCSA